MLKWVILVQNPSLLIDLVLHDEIDSSNLRCTNPKSYAKPWSRTDNRREVNACHKL